MKNRCWKLAARPVGMVKASDFSFVTDETGEPGAGEVVVAVEYLSLDPAMRGWMNEGRSYVPPVKIGEVMRALGIGKVVASGEPALPVGATVTGTVGVQEYARVPSSALTLVSDPSLAPLPRFLGALGMPGMTAYFGLLDVGAAKAGETVVVSAASGAVGAVAGQIAKIKGCRVIGLAGGPDKCRYLLELGFDAAIDYKNENVRDALKQHCEKGMDVYFDNVGGQILDDCLGRLARGARIVICGAISQYNSPTGVQGPKNIMALLVARARMEGFVVFDFRARYADAQREIAGWLADGKMQAREDVAFGIESFPDTLARLYRGENFGKLVLKVAGD
jgi:NADPH-dependent curcumin reductase CurA